MSKDHLGSSIDSFLQQEGIFEAAQEEAVNEVIAWQKSVRSQTTDTGRPPARSNE